jgi:hypothetical protein
MKTRNFRSSSISISFWLPLAGCKTLSVRDGGFFAMCKGWKLTKEIFCARAKLADIRDGIHGSQKT